MSKITINSNAENTPEFDVNVIGEIGPEFIPPFELYEVGSEHIHFKWGIPSNLTTINFYISDKGNVGQNTLQQPTILIDTLSEYIPSDYKLIGFAPNSRFYLQIEFVYDDDTKSYKTFNIRTKKNNSDYRTPISDISMVTPNILAVTLTDFKLTSFNLSQNSTITEPTPHNAPIYQDINNWSISDINGEVYTIQNLYRDSVPIGSKYFNSISEEGRIEQNDAYLDVNHTLYFVLDKPVGNKNLIFIDSPLDYNFKFFFDDTYTVTKSVQLNQVGYNPRATERYAYFSKWLGDGGGMTLSNIIDNLDNTKIVKFENDKMITVLDNIPYRIHNEMSERHTRTEVCAFDISQLPASEGTEYFMHVPGVGISYPTQVSESAAFKLFYTIFRFFTHNRWAQELSSDWTPWTRPIDHTGNLWEGDDSDKNIAVPDPGIFKPTTPKLKALDPIYGGHHDAGDFDIRPTHFTIAQALLDLFDTYKDTKFVDGQLNIPESGDGIPDVLSEALYSVKMWEGLQDPETGAVSKGLESFGHPNGIRWAHHDELPYWSFYKDPFHTIRCSGLFAHAAFLVKPYNIDRSNELKERAIKAYNHFTSLNLDSSTNFDGGYMYASIQLFRLTNDQYYGDIVEMLWRRFNKWGGGFFDHPNTQILVNSDFKITGMNTRSFLALGYADLENVPSFRMDRIILQLNQEYNHYSHNLKNVYAFKNGKPSGYSSDWGQAAFAGRWCKAFMAQIQCSKSKSGRPLTPAREQELFNYMSLSADWSLGCNPMGKSFFTGLGTDTVKEALWLDSLMFDKYTDLGPIPGCLVYGPAFPGGHYYYWWSRNMTYPLLEQRPAWRQWIDVRSFVKTSEFDMGAVVPSLCIFGALIKDGGITPPESWGPNGSEIRNYLPPTDINSLIN